jgi:hypothetical protein
MREFTTCVLDALPPQTDTQNALGQARLSAVALFTMLFLSSLAQGATLRVPLDYATIQAGLDASSFGDTVLVAPGTYTDYETRNIGGGFPETSCAFLVDEVLLKSESGPAATTIDLLEITGLQPAGITAEELPSELTAVEGFTIEGRDRALGASIAYCGNVTFRDCVFQNYDGGPTYGGAMIINGNISIIGTTFKNCKAIGAGAIYQSSGHIDLIGCTVQESGNTAVFVTESGGEIESVYIAQCQFLDNWNQSGGGSGALGVAAANGGTLIDACLFKGNVNYGTGGGGLDLGSFGSKTVENCIFIDNHALGANGKGGLSGGGNPLFLVRGNTFINNSKVPTPPAGGSVRFDTYGSFENNVIVGSEGGAAISAPNGIETTCNVYWNNPLGIGIPLSPTDREVDPMFCDPVVYDLTLRDGSPCLPDNPLGCGLIGALEQGCGSVSAESKSWGAIKSLYR